MLVVVDSSVVGVFAVAFPIPGTRGRIMGPRVWTTVARGSGNLATSPSRRPWGFWSNLTNLVKFIEFGQKPTWHEKTRNSTISTPPPKTGSKPRVPIPDPHPRKNGLFDFRGPDLVLSKPVPTDSRILEQKPVFGIPPKMSCAQVGF